jgi:hypothetical protein
LGAVASRFSELWFGATIETAIKCCFSVGLVEHLAMGQVVVAVAEVREVYTLLVVEAA